MPPLLFSPSIFPSIRVFSHESTLPHEEHAKDFSSAAMVFLFLQSFLTPSVLVSGSLHQTTTTGWLTTTEMCSLIALEAGSLQSRWRQGWFLLEAPRMNLFHARLLAYGIPWLVFASLQSPPSPSPAFSCFFPVCVFSLFLNKFYYFFAVPCSMRGLFFPQPGI